METLRDLHARASAQSLLLTARLLRIVEAFENARIPMIALKGPALSQQLYGDPGMRHSVDLDLLVPEQSIAAASAVLHAAGYQAEGPRGVARIAARRPGGRSSRSATRKGVAVDLHWATAPADYPCRIGPDRLWASLAHVTIAGRRVPVLRSECLLVYLSIHGARHCWTKLRWLTDVAMLVERKGLDWNEVEVIAAESRASRALGLALLLAHDALGAVVPERLLRAARRGCRRGGGRRGAAARSPVARAGGPAHRDPAHALQRAARADAHERRTARRRAHGAHRSRRRTPAAAAGAVVSLLSGSRREAGRQIRAVVIPDP